MSKVHIIAEAGTNHNGDRHTAVRLADAAVQAGADSVKFQIIHPDGLYLPRLFAHGSSVNNEVYQKRKEMMLSDEDYEFIATHCRATGIPFSASVFDEDGLELLNRFDPIYVKIASCDLNNSRFLKAVAEKGRKMILSTGMSTLAEIDRAVTDITATGNMDLVLMHCVSVYPCPVELTNLGFISTLQKAFGFPVGFSDHTQSTLASAIAVSMDVEWIEKHFTLDASQDGFDHAYALEPGALNSFIKDLGRVLQACGRATVKVSNEESRVKERARRGLYAAQTIEEGEVLDWTKLLVVRPETALSPNDATILMGKKSARRIEQYEALTFEAFC